MISLRKSLISLNQISQTLNMSHLKMMKEITMKMRSMEKTEVVQTIVIVLTTMNG